MSEMSLGLSAVALPGAKPEVKRYFFDVSMSKLIVMSLFTLGLYEIYWFYKNWQLAKQRGQAVSPALRALFSIFFVIPLLREIREIARSVQTGTTMSPGSVGGLFIVLAFAWRLPKPFWLIGYASVIPLAIAQGEVAKIHRALGLDPTVNNRYSWKNIVGIVIGGLIHTLAIIGFFLPDAPA